MEISYEVKHERLLRVVFLVGEDNPSTRLAISGVCSLPNVIPVAVLLDTEPVSLVRRTKNLRRNLRKEGWRYLPYRIIQGLRTMTDTLVEKAVVSRKEVLQLLKRAFPDRCFSLYELGSQYGFQLCAAGNLNAPEAIRVLVECKADLGIVLGTRVLRPGTFGVPQLGSINLHKGRVPQYRGLPPGFWELYDGAPVASVTVHFVDEGLDTGDIIATSDVPILSTDTPVSLLEKLHQEGARVLVSAVGSIQAGTEARQPQAKRGLKPRTTPTLAEVRQLRRRLPHWKPQSEFYAVVKNLYSLFAYYLGPYSIARGLHRRNGRAAVLLYHRVNDFSRDVLTVDTEAFAAQLVAVSARFTSMSTGELVDCIRQKRRIPPTTIVIHFDDCYRDVYTTGAPLLAAAGMSATAFVNPGFVDSDRVFQHDQQYPFVYENFRAVDIRAWVDLGFEVGSHTVNHVDLGQCAPEDGRAEIIESGRQLEAMTGSPVRYFSFPFGGVQNIRQEAVQSVQEAGCLALFSAYGGFVGPGTKPYNVPRFGVNHEIKPLYLLLEIEGLAPHQILTAVKNRT
jgi:peptidoglycan/xylan/chitin deacetylase (PgdA/CDA1 family)